MAPVDPSSGGTTALQVRPSTNLSTLVMLPPAEPAAEDDAIHFRDLWRIIVKRRWTVFAVFAIVVITALAATFLMTPVFRPGITLKIERETPKVVEFKDVTPLESQGDRDFYQTQYELLKSRTLAERVMEQMSLKHNRSFNRDDTKSWWDGVFQREAEAAPVPVGVADPAHRAGERAVTLFLKSLAVEPVRNSRLVKVYFESPDRKLAAEVLNNLAQNFINVNLERRYDASSYAKSFLEEKLAQTKARLEDSERTLVDFQRDQQIISVDDRQNILAQTMNEFNLAAARAEQDRAKFESQYTEFNSRPESSPQVVDNKAIQTLKEQRARMQAEYQDSSRVFKPGFPKMQQLNAGIEELDRKIGEETEVVRRSVEGSYKAMVRQERTILARLETSKKNVLDLQDRSIQFNILKREVDTNRQLYDGLLQRLKEVGVAGGVGINNITVVDPAEPPILAHRPRLDFNLAIAVVLGLVGGVGLAFFLEYLDDTLKAPEEMERLTRLPVLGVVPRIKVPKGQENGSLALIAKSDARSTIAEAYRSVRTALQFSTREGAPRRFAVTSTSSGEGKTTSALSLAIQFAQAGDLVVVIDADLRNSSMHKHLGVNNSRGLSNYLSSDIPALAVVRTTTVPNLFVVPSGPLPPNPVELLSGPKLASLLDQLGARFAHVIVDSPPVLGIADAIVIGNQVGPVLFVVAAGSTRKAHARAALKRLYQAGVQPIGAVMAKLDLRDGMYGYESAYYYYKTTSDLPAAATA